MDRKFNARMFKTHPSMTCDKTNDETQCAIYKGTTIDPLVSVCKKCEGTDFSKDGFNDCCRLAERTKTHVTSHMHKDVIACNLRLYGKVISAANVKTRLSSTLDTNQIENRKQSKLIMLTIRLLTMQRLAFRGHQRGR